MKFVPLVALLALTLAGCNTSSNYFQEEADPSLEGDKTLFGTVLGMTGVVEQPKDEIDYSPRAPIAIPPTRELPAPQTEPVSEVTGLDWPDDPENAERERRLARIEAGKKTAAYEGSFKQSENARLTPEEIQAGRMAGAGVPTREDRTSWVPEDNDNRRLSPRELAKKLTMRDSSPVLTEDGQAVPRRYLVEPPDTYREPAASVPVPEPGDVELSEWAKKELYKKVDRRPARLQK